jgi:hypothetical protein
MDVASEAKVVSKCFVSFLFLFVCLFVETRYSRLNVRRDKARDWKRQVRRMEPSVMTQVSNCTYGKWLTSARVGRISPRTTGPDAVVLQSFMMSPGQNLEPRPSRRWSKWWEIMESLLMCQYASACLRIFLLTHEVIVIANKIDDAPDDQIAYERDRNESHGFKYFSCSTKGNWKLFSLFKLNCRQYQCSSSFQLLGAWDDKFAFRYDSQC